MNRKIEPFKRCLVMQNTLVNVMHRKLVFVIVESSVIWGTVMWESVYYRGNNYGYLFWCV